MKNALFICLSFLALAGLFGCSGKKGPSVSAKFIVGNIGTSLPNGWTYIHATSNTGEKIASAFAPGDPLSFVMNPGLWSFSVLMWEGPEVMGGKLRCGAVDGFDVSGDSVTVAMTISSDLCLNDFVGAAFHDSAFGTHRLKLVGCQNLDGIATGNETCTNPLYMAGDSNSLRVSLGSPLGPRIISGCLNHTNLFKHKFIDRNFYSQMRIPMGGTRVVPVTIEGYRDENCTQRENIYDFPEGIARPENLTTANRFLTSNQIDHRAYFKADPYPRTSYPTQQSSCTYKKIKYSYQPGSLTSCTCDASATGECTGSYAGGTNCPNPGDSSTGAVCAGDNIPACLGDNTNNDGPNCDAGSFAYDEIYCQVIYHDFKCIVDGVDETDTYRDASSCEASGGTTIQHNNSGFSGPYYDATLGDMYTQSASCTKLFSESVACGGEGPTCQMGSTTPPNYNVLYIADNGIGYGASALAAQVPDFSCSEGHCYPYRTPGQSSNTYSYGGKPVNDIREALEEVIGASDGARTYDYNNSNTNGSGSSLPTVSQLYAYRDTYNYDDGVERGEIGDIQRDFIGIVGGLLHRAGYTTCASVPTGGQIVPVSFEEDGIVKTYELKMVPATKTIPTGYPDAGLALEKRIELYAQGILEGLFEFRCTAPGNKAGYTAWKYDEGDYRGWTETYYHGDSNTTATVHIRQFSESLYDSWIGKNIYAFQKVTVDKFNLYMTEASIDSGYGPVGGLYRNYEGIGAFVDKATSKAVYNKLEGYLNEDPSLGEPAYTYESEIEGNISSRFDDSSDNGIQLNFVDAGTIDLMGLDYGMAFTDGVSTVEDVINVLNSEGYVVVRDDSPTKLLTDVISAPAWSNEILRGGRDPGFVTGGMTFTPGASFVMNSSFLSFYSDDVIFTDTGRTYVIKDNSGSKPIVQRTQGGDSDPGGNNALDSGVVNVLGTYSVLPVAKTSFSVADASLFCEGCGISSAGGGQGVVKKINGNTLEVVITAGSFANGEGVDYNATYISLMTTISSTPTPLDPGCVDLNNENGTTCASITPAEPTIALPFAGAQWSPEYLFLNVTWGTAPF